MPCCVFAHIDERRGRETSLSLGGKALHCLSGRLWRHLLLTCLFSDVRLSVAQRPILSWASVAGRRPSDLLLFVSIAPDWALGNPPSSPWFGLYPHLLWLHQSRGHLSIAALWNSFSVSWWWCRGAGLWSAAVWCWWWGATWEAGSATSWCRYTPDIGFSPRCTRFTTDISTRWLHQLASSVFRQSNWKSEAAETKDDWVKGRFLFTHFLSRTSSL